MITVAEERDVFTTNRRNTLENLVVISVALENSRGPRHTAIHHPHPASTITLHHDRHHHHCRHTHVRVTRVHCCVALAPVVPVVPVARCDAPHLITRHHRVTLLLSITSFEDLVLTLMEL
ncbi:hypothetical protein E2C01_020134 [Portunus trituberculatus]|uniref:Uncharacterized protein n=1 Tax=Portunus trituberculatus TaxID=210409 RepID=A0A5B7DZ07_PORTR|nr:hypothetical protein [Portunus trituberculatus]